MPIFFSDTTGPLGALEAWTSSAICTDPVSGVAIFPLSLVVPADVGKVGETNLRAFFFFLGLLLCFSIPICYRGYRHEY